MLRSITQYLNELNQGALWKDVPKDLSLPEITAIIRGVDVNTGNLRSTLKYNKDLYQKHMDFDKSRHVGV
jgi:hypothetical protein